MIGAQLIIAQWVIEGRLTPEQAEDAWTRIVTRDPPATINIAYHMVMAELAESGVDMTRFAEYPRP